MKLTITCLVFLATILATQAQDNNVKGKGDACTENEECGIYNCVEGHCGCKVGHMPVTESHAQDTGPNSQGIEICKKLVGSGCNHDSDCYSHLPNSKCGPDHTCFCNEADECTDGAVTLTVMSLTTMMAIVIAMLKVW